MNYSGENSSAFARSRYILANFFKFVFTNFATSCVKQGMSSARWVNATVAVIHFLQCSMMGLKTLPNAFRSAIAVIWLQFMDRRHFAALLLSTLFWLWHGSNQRFQQLAALFQKNVSCHDVLLLKQLYDEAVRWEDGRSQLSCLGSWCLLCMGCRRLKLVFVFKQLERVTKCVDELLIAPTYLLWTDALMHGTEGFLIV